MGTLDCSLVGLVSFRCEGVDHAGVLGRAVPVKTHVVW